jgi:cytochrome P450
LQFAGTRFALLLVPLMPHWLFKHVDWMPYYGHLRAVDEMLYAIIRRRRAGPPPARPDVLADLLEARHEDGAALSDEEIRDAVITMLVAGHETTTIGLAWIFEQVLSHPAACERIDAELGQAAGGGLLEAEHVEHLPYLEAAIKEGLRIRTVVPFVTRRLKADFEAGGRVYPAGAHLSPCIHLVHRRGELYPQPEAFRPERFLERRFTASEWLPFGGGNRMCIGMAFSLYEMKVVLATVFAHTRIRRAPGSRTKMVRRGVLIAPADGTRVVVEEKRAAVPA